MLVNAVAPAVIETPILSQVSDEHIDYMTSRIPMGRVGKPEKSPRWSRFSARPTLAFPPAPSTTSPGPRHLLASLRGLRRGHDCPPSRPNRNSWIAANVCSDPGPRKTSWLAP